MYDKNNGKEYLKLESLQKIWTAQAGPAIMKNLIKIFLLTVYRL